MVPTQNHGEMVPQEQDGDESVAPPQHDDDQSEDDDAGDNTPAGTTRQPTQTLVFRRRSARSRPMEPPPVPAPGSRDDDPDDHFGRCSRVDNTGGASQFLPLLLDNSFDEDDDPNISLLPMLAVLDEVEEMSRAHPNNPDLTSRTDQIYLPVSDRIFDHHFDAPDRYMIRLMDVLGRANCPLWVTDSIVKITREECQRKHGLDFRRDNIVSRESFLKKLGKRFPVPQPILSPMLLETAPPPKKNAHCGIAPHGSPRHTVQLIYYDFMDQVKDLNAEATIFGDLNNLCVDHEDPFGGDPARNDGLVDEVVDAHWCRETRKYIVDNLVEDNEPFLIVPVAFYADKTGVDVFQRYGVEPLLFTILLIKRLLRNKADSWRLMGFLPDMDLKSSATKNRDRESPLGKSRSVRNYHQCLSKILESFIENQGFKKPVYGFFRLGPFIKKVRLFFPVACATGDALSGDHFCGRHQVYRNTMRISRPCQCHPDEADDLEHDCQWLSMDWFQEESVLALKLMGVLEFDDDDTVLSEKEGRMRLKEIEEELNDLSQHIFDSAFANVWFGVNERGILGATPVDLMHAFLHGIVTCAIRIYLASFSDSEKDELDQLVDQMLFNVHSSERKNFPRIGFSRGLTNLTLITHDEWAGVVFTLALVAISKDGRELMLRVAKRNSDKEKAAEKKRAAEAEEIPTGVYCGPNDMLDILESILSFHAWYKCGHPFPVRTNAEKEAILKAVREMLYDITTTLPRHAGNGWKLQKLHDLLHLALDMLLFGSPLNWDTGPCENNLITFAKNPAAVSRKRHNGFLKSLAQRLFESATVRRAVNALNRADGVVMWPLEDESEESVAPQDNVSSCVVGHAKYELIFEAKRRQLQTGEQKRRHVDRFERGVSFKWLSTATVAGHRDIHPALLNYFREEIEHSDKSFTRVQKIECFTEYERDSVLFRAHPHYQSNGEWYDWVMLKCQYDDDSYGRRQRKNARNKGAFGRDFYPTKLLCFFRHPEDGSIRAVGHCCAANPHQNDSQLFERWELQCDKNGYPILWDFSVDGFGERVLVVEDHPGLFEYTPTTKTGKVEVTLVLPRERFWPEQFFSPDQ